MNSETKELRAFRAAITAESLEERIEQARQAKLAQIHAGLDEQDRVERAAAKREVKAANKARRGVDRDSVCDTDSLVAAANRIPQTKTLHPDCRIRAAALAVSYVENRPLQADEIDRLESNKPIFPFAGRITASGQRVYG